MYADKITPSMAAAIDETNRRRAKQIAYNEAHGIDPQPLRKKIADILDDIYREAEDTEAQLGLRRRGRGSSSRRQGAGQGDAAAGAGSARRRRRPGRGHGPRRPGALIQELNDQMLAAARELQFELAARIRDEVAELKKEMRGMDAAGVR